MKIVLFSNTDWYLYNFVSSFAISLRKTGYEVILVSPSGPYGQRLQALGFRWFAAPMQRKSFNPWSELRFLVWFVRFLRRERVTLLHAFTIKCVIYASLAARSCQGIARAASVSGLGYSFTNRSVQARAVKPLVKWALRLALGGDRCRLILQNRDDVSLFYDYKLVDNEKIRLIRGSGVNTKRFRPAKKLPSIKNFRIVMPARLLWDKGVGELIEAAKLLKTRQVKVSIALAGESDSGNPAAISVEQVKEWHNQGVVEWLGKVDDMPAIFQSVNAVVLPSYREGLPKSLIEAAACGLALVTTDAPGCREVVTHEVDGLLVPIKDVESLADAIERLVNDPELCQRLGKAARHKVLTEFDSRIIDRQTMAVYDELIHSSIKAG